MILSKSSWSNGSKLKHQPVSYGAVLLNRIDIASATTKRCFLCLRVCVGGGGGVSVVFVCCVCVCVCVCVGGCCFGVTHTHTHTHTHTR